MAGLQRVFLSELQGNVLIVSPRGDSVSFHELDINAEISAIESELASPAVTGLVFDLHESNYFGSVILGAMASMAQQVKERNGRVAVANASDDMQGIMKVMRLDALWTYHDSRKAAIKAVR